jgi:hypothetical protein
MTATPLTGIHPSQLTTRLLKSFPLSSEQFFADKKLRLPICSEADFFECVESKKLGFVGQLLYQALGFQRERCSLWWGF